VERERKKRRKEKKWGCIDDKRNGDSLKVGQVGRSMVHVGLLSGTVDVASHRHGCGLHR
jgi:hypothetical protein